MILDILSAFCFQKAFTATGYSTDAPANAGAQDAGYIDLGNMDAFKSNGEIYFGVGEPLKIEALVTALMNDAETPRTATCLVTIEMADNTAFSSNLQTLLTLGTFPAGSAAGTRFQSYLVYGALYRRYLRAKFTMAVTNLTAGAFSCYLAHDLETSPIYPSRITI